MIERFESFVSWLAAICLLLVFFMSPLVANANTFGTKLGGPAGESTASWSCDDADLLCESFDAVGEDDANWTLVEAGGTSTADPDNTHTGEFHCDAASVYDLRLFSDGNNEASAWNDLGANQSAAYGVFFIYVDSLTLTEVTFFGLGGGSYSDRNLMFSLNVDGGSAFEMTLTAYGKTAATTTQDYALDTWHKIEFQYIQNQAATGATVWINGTKELEVDGPNYTVRYPSFYMRLGSGAVEIDNVKIDTTEMPTCE